MTPEQEKSCTRLSEMLRTRFEKEDSVFQAPAAVKLTVMMKEDVTAGEKGGFKVKPFLGGEAFLFQSVRIGARNSAIFCFEPFDAQPYSSMEVAIAKAPTEMPGFSDAVIDYASELGCTSPVLKASLAYLEQLANRDVAKTAAEQQLQKAKSDAAEYTDNALFGMF